MEKFILLIFLVGLTVGYKNLQCNLSIDSDICNLSQYGSEKNLSDVTIYYPNDTVIKTVLMNSISEDYLPLIVEKFQQMEKLQIENCGNLNLENLRNVSSLKTLLIHNNKIKIISNEKFIGSYNLAKIEIIESEVQEVAEFAFRNLSKLQELNLKNNNISELHPLTFANLTELTTLLLAENNIQELKDGTFDSNLNLELIDLSKNSINVIYPVVWANLKKLKGLNLSKNQCIDKKYEEVPKVMDQVFFDLEHCLSSVSCDHGLCYILEKFFNLRNQNNKSKTTYMILNIINGILTVFGILGGVLLYCRKKKLLWWKSQNGYTPVRDDPILD
jgi:Leucine-rich repeat (LRR) protein